MLTDLEKNKESIAGGVSSVRWLCNGNERLCNGGFECSSEMMNDE